MDADEKRRKYETTIRKISSSWEETTNAVARTAMVSAYLLHHFENIIWSGFFLLLNGELTVGPYNGPPARPVLEKHKGVCWSCVDSGKVVIVHNTHEFEGHIKREGPSNSEISVPVKNSLGKVLGVLHLDSADFDVFDAIDVEYLSRIAEMVEESLEKMSK